MSLAHQVVAELDETRLAALTGTAPASAAADNGLDVPAAAELWVEQVLELERARSASYVKRVRSLLRTWVGRLAGVRVRDWTTADTTSVMNAAAAAGLSVSSRRQLLSVLRQLGAWATQAGMVEQDPAVGVTVGARRGAGRRRPSSPSTMQVEQLLDAMREQGHHEWASMCAVAAYSGLRRGEVAALQTAHVTDNGLRVVQAVDPNRTAAAGNVVVDGTTVAWQSRWGCLQLPKWGWLRVALLPAHLRDVVQAAAQRADGGPLWTTPRGRLLASYGHWDRQVWRPAAEAAGWPHDAKGRPIWTPHSLRHHAAGWQLDVLGIPVAAVSAMLGHADPSITMRIYVTAQSDHLDDAAARSAGWVPPAV